jgi:hypothetical protein
VHGRDDAQVRQARVTDLAGLQAFGDHADDGAAGRQRRVGDDAHQADVPAAIDEANTAASHFAAERGGRVTILRAGAWAGAAEDAERCHGHGAGRC